MNFEQFSLDTRIQSGIKKAGYATPTPIQQQAIPLVLNGRDLIGIAQTGTGKTAAFALPILQHLTCGPRGRIRALIVAPTRELAEQIHQVMTDFGKQTQTRSMTIYGGVSKIRQIETLRRGVEIVVATPGRLLDIANEGNINLRNVEILVLDEADRLCDMGFLPDIRRIIKLLPTKRQTLFFSATMPGDVRKLADTILKNPETAQIGIIAPAKTVSHALYPVQQTKKKELLFALLQRTAAGRVLIFTRTKRRARFLANDLKKEKYRAAALQGNMSQNQRQLALDGFRSGKFDLLVATDVAARGIDVEDISHVINYDMPDTADAYTHRIGRTGRAELSGEAFTFSTPEDVDMVRAIEKVLKAPIEKRVLPEFDYGGFKPEFQLSTQANTSKSRHARHPGGNNHRNYRSKSRKFPKK